MHTTPGLLIIIVVAILLLLAVKKANNWRKSHIGLYEGKYASFDEAVIDKRNRFYDKLSLVCRSGNICPDYHSRSSSPSTRLAWSDACRLVQVESDIDSLEKQIKASNNPLDVELGARLVEAERQHSKILARWHNGLLIHKSFAGKQYVSL